MDQRSVIMFGAGLWGLVALVAIYCAVGSIERDLTVRSRSELAGAGMRWASVRLDGRDATLEGAAPSAEAQAQAQARLVALAGVRTVHDRTTVAPSAE